MKYVAFVLALALTVGASAVTPVEFQFDPPLPAGWKITRQQPPSAARETMDF